MIRVKCIFLYFMFAFDNQKKDTYKNQNFLRKIQIYKNIYM